MLNTACLQKHIHVLRSQLSCYHKDDSLPIVGIFNPYALMISPWRGTFPNLKGGTIV